MICMQSNKNALFIRDLVDLLEYAYVNNLPKDFVKTKLIWAYNYYSKNMNV